jgi:hypothetical protein
MPAGIVAYFDVPVEGVFSLNPFKRLGERGPELAQSIFETYERKLTHYSSLPWIDVARTNSRVRSYPP